MTQLTRDQSDVSESHPVQTIHSSSAVSGASEGSLKSEHSQVLKLCHMIMMS